MWHNCKGGCGIKICIPLRWVWHKVCRSDHVLIKRDGVGLWVWLFSSGCGWGCSLSGDVGVDCKGSVDRVHSKAIKV